VDANALLEIVQNIQLSFKLHRHYLRNNNIIISSKILFVAGLLKYYLLQGGRDSECKKKKTRMSVAGGGHEPANIRFVFGISGVAGCRDRNVQNRLLRVWPTRTSRQISIEVRLVQVNSAGT
jgi:hypothetical protein